MANADTPFGLRAVGHPSGLSRSRVRAYYVPASYATALFVGDPVVKTGTSNTSEVSFPGVSAAAGALPEVNKATVGTNRITGVIVGIAADPDNLGRIYKPASTEAVVYVNDDPQTEFEVQADGTIAAAQVGLNASLIYTNSGDTNTGRSGAELDSGTTTAPATTAGLQLNILRAEDRPDNEIGSDFVKLRVRINSHTEAEGGAGI